MALGWRGQYYKYREFSLNLLAMYKQRGDLQAFLEIVLSLVTLIIFIVFAIKPTALTIISLTQEIQSKKETLKILNQKISDLQTANNALIKNQNVLPDIESAIFNSPELDTVAKQVMGLAVKNSVTVSGISIDKTVIVGKVVQLEKDPTTDKEIAPLPEGARPIPLVVSVKGDSTNLIAFMKDVENLRIPVKMDSGSLDAIELESGKTLTEKVSGRVPYLGKPN